VATGRGTVTWSAAYIRMCAIGAVAHRARRWMRIGW